MTNEQQEINYERVAKAIEYIKANFKNQPGLEEAAAQVHLSPIHFQRLFSDWAGTTPKKILKYISMELAKKSLGKRQATRLYPICTFDLNYLVYSIHYY